MKNRLVGAAMVAAFVFSLGLIFGKAQRFENEYRDLAPMVRWTHCSMLIAEAKR